ncbi:hypothetical protein PIB30_098718 [Stylosanthes scabra]|uniref:Uncharacterized protein n=1 Tax=Stylosanthes scabra TaxID=79078 RepID=A0ABU6RWY5_9FABA|nr:hypothetical protein [Stylosanthes scabra]
MALYVGVLDAKMSLGQRPHVIREGFTYDVVVSPKNDDVLDVLASLIMNYLLLVDDASQVVLESLSIYNEFGAIFVIHDLNVTIRRDVRNCEGFGPSCSQLSRKEFES